MTAWVTSLTTLGRLIFLHENGLSYNALGPFHPLAQLMPLSSLVMLCMSSVGFPTIKPDWVIWLS